MHARVRGVSGKVSNCAVVSPYANVMGSTTVGAADSALPGRPSAIPQHVRRRNVLRLVNLDDSVADGVKRQIRNRVYIKLTHQICAVSFCCLNT